MKINRLMLWVLLLGFVASPAFALQRLPARQSTVDPSGIVFSSETNLQDALEDLSGWVTNSLDLVFDSDLTGSNVFGLLYTNDMVYGEMDFGLVYTNDLTPSNDFGLVYSDDIADVVRDSDLTLSNDFGLVYTSQVLNILREDATIEVDSSMSWAEIYALGDTYDYLAEGVVLTYQFDSGTYDLAESPNSFSLNELLVPGRGSIQIYGDTDAASSDAIDVIFDITTLGASNRSVMGLSGEGQPKCPVTLSGFHLQGYDTGGYVHGLELQGGAQLTVRAPFKVSACSAYGVIIGGGSKLTLRGDTTEGSDVPIIINGSGTSVAGGLGVGASSRLDYNWKTLNAGGEGYAGLSFGGGADAFGVALSAADCGVLDLGGVGASYSGATTSSVYDILVEYGGVVDLYNAAGYGTNVFSSSSIVPSSAAGGYIR